jgi:hypothetical protein
MLNTIEKLVLANNRMVQLEGQLQRQRLGLLNLIEFRKIAGSDRYGALTREEIEQSIAEIDAVLGKSNR